MYERHDAAYLIAVIALGLIGVLVPVSRASALTTPACSSGVASQNAVGRPTAKLAWRAELRGPTGVYERPAPAGARARPDGWIGPAASWLLVLGAARADTGRCWLKVRLPTRPNDAAGWIGSVQVRLRATRWRIVVSLAARTLTLDRAGVPRGRVRVVIGAPATPTPTGLFSIIGAWRSPADAFLGSWVLALTAHSDVLLKFDGGNGRVGIHGRGGASLRVPLGSAGSHGCVRLANPAIDWLVRTVGAVELAGTPVRVDAG